MLFLFIDNMVFKATRQLMLTKKASLPGHITIRKTILLSFRSVDDMLLLHNLRFNSFLCGGFETLFETI
jgi:hypothetical protein